MNKTPLESFNPALLQTRRQHKGLSQADLAQRVGITQGHYSKFENGLLSPGEVHVQSLSRALDCPESFFFQQDRLIGPPVSVHPMFRKRSSVGPREIEQLQAGLNLRIMAIRRLLKAVDMRPQFKLPRLDVDAYEADVEEIARLVRATWLLPQGPLENLTEAVEQAGCIVVHCDLPGRVDGVTLDIPGMPPCLFLNVSMPADRMRFSLAHELGHLVMHEVPSPEMEDEANRFASALLMPAADIRSQFGTVSLQRLAAMKRGWRVSMGALLMRADSVGLLSSGQKQYLWRQMSTRGYRLQEPPSTEFPREQPTALPDILRLHMEDLGYSLKDLSAALHLHVHEFRQMFQVGGGHLRVVENSGGL